MAGFQLWLNLPGRDKMQLPRYRDFKAADLPRFTSPEGVVVTVIVGSSHGSGSGRAPPLGHPSARLHRRLQHHVGHRHASVGGGHRVDRIDHRQARHHLAKHRIAR